MNRKEIARFLKNNRNFCLLWSSQILSLVSINMVNFVMATKIYEKTGSTLAVSFLWVFYFLPAFFLGPFSGFFIDHWSKRKILVVTNILQFVAMLLYIPAKDQIYQIYPVVFLYSILNQFYVPAEAASIPWLVEKKYLPLTNSLFMITSQSALVLGMGLSGVLMKFFGKDNPIIIAAVCLAIAAVSVYFLPKDEPKRKKNIFSFTEFFTQIKMGYSFIKDKRIVLFPILLVSLLNVFLVILAVAIPDFSATILKIDVQDAAITLVVPIGIGALLGTFLLSRYAGKLRKKKIIKIGLLLAGIIFFIFSLFLPYVGNFRVILAFILMMVLGVAGLFIFVPNQTLIQEKTPALLRGRVFGAWGFISSLITFPFLLFSASIVEAVGMKLFMFIIGAVCLGGHLLVDKSESYILTEENGNK